MREIIFRGKRKDNGEWIEGFPILIKKDHSVGKSEIIEKIFCDSIESYVAVIKSEEVVSETLGQFTGLIDKNGKKIFEGDIIKYQYELGSIIKDDFVVCWRDDYAGYYPFCDKQFLEGYKFEAKKSEVVGNVYDEQY